MIKEGRRNRKLGNRVMKGPHAGAKIYQLSFEERASCPSSCRLWDICYGNNMPFAKRYDHTAPDLLRHLQADVARVLAKGPVLIRLHVLGDFFSEEYVRLWGDMLRSHEGLAIYGYTAHGPSSGIGQELHKLALEHGWSRAAIRFSGLDAPYRAAVVSEAPRPECFTCPEQMGFAPSCAECAACWDGEKSVRFIPH